jgi:hypothetical protein
MPAISNGIVRSVRVFCSTEFIALNFNKISTTLAGISTVNTKIIEINQSFNAIGKTIG